MNVFKRLDDGSLKKHYTLLTGRLMYLFCDIISTFQGVYSLIVILYPVKPFRLTKAVIYFGQIIKALVIGGTSAAVVFP